MMEVNTDTLVNFSKDTILFQIELPHEFMT